MNKVLSFCLWGDKPLYNIGALKNAELAPFIFPGWKMKIHCGSSVPNDILEGLAYFGCNIVHYPEPGNWKSMLWRYYPASDETVDVMLSQDCDSRLSPRLARAVDRWLESDKGVFTVKDHPCHLSVPLMGGNSGFKKGAYPEMKQIIQDHVGGDYYQVDQNLLKDVVYPCVKDDLMTFSPFEGLPLPTLRIGREFCGQVFDQYDRPVVEHMLPILEQVK